ncbi:MAG: MFS transporter, partial [Planctomycetes bacterium]|nr:MFS transporter [Planctomycetota bacterium]
MSVLKDHRVWVLSMVYACCFGVELTIHLNAAEYYHENFDLSITMAGLIAGSFGIMALFARSLGGFFGDRIGRRLGLAGRARWLFFALMAEAIALACFSQMTGDLGLSIVALLIFALFVHMSAGATYSVTPFINRKGYGTVSGIVGAGGNLGAVAAGFLFRGNIDMNSGFLIMAAAVGFTALCILTIRFRKEDESAARVEMVQAIVSKHSHNIQQMKNQLELESKAS